MPLGQLKAGQERQTDRESLFLEAAKWIPGGVNSPVRAFAGVGGTPFFTERGEGPFLYDTQGNRYIDYVLAWGPLILGHAHPAVREVLEERLAKGIAFGTPTAGETGLAALLCSLVPSLEQVRLVNSGTEAAMSAVRLARGCTGRDRILKFAGHYHGHSDGLLAKAGSGLLDKGLPDSLGVPPDFTAHTLVAEFNDAEGVQEIFRQAGAEIACVILEPVAGNMGCVLPAAGFLELLRALCDKHGSLLIFDEVMTGFRVGPGGVQERFGVLPDLSVLGKIIGGGLPVGAFGGRRELMEQLAPAGAVYQAGTLSGNPLAVGAGLATLEQLAAPDFYTRLEKLATMLTAGLAEQAERAGVPLLIHQLGGMFSLFFTEQREVQNLPQAHSCDREAYSRFFQVMLEEGVYFAPSPWESAFLSSAHTETEIARTLEAAKRAFASVGAMA